MNERERMNTRRLIQVTELEANKLKLDYEICFSLINSGGQYIKTIKACVYLCRVYSLESYRCLSNKSRVDVEADAI